MNKLNQYISLVLGLIALGYLIYSFIGENIQSEIFGFEVKIWTFRIFWAVVAAILMFSFYKKSTRSR